MRLFTTTEKVLGILVLANIAASAAVWVQNAGAQPDIDRCEKVITDSATKREKFDIEYQRVAHPTFEQALSPKKGG